MAVIYVAHRPTTAPPPVQAYWPHPPCDAPLPRPPPPFLPQQQQQPVLIPVPFQQRPRVLVQQAFGLLNPSIVYMQGVVGCWVPQPAVQSQVGAQVPQMVQPPVRPPPMFHSSLRFQPPPSFRLSPPYLVHSPPSVQSPPSVPPPYLDSLSNVYVAGSVSWPWEPYYNYDGGCDCDCWDGNDDGYRCGDRYDHQPEFTQPCSQQQQQHEAKQKQNNGENQGQKLEQKGNEKGAEKGHQKATNPILKLKPKPILKKTSPSPPATSAVAKRRSRSVSFTADTVPGSPMREKGEMYAALRGKAMSKRDGKM